MERMNYFHFHDTSRESPLRAHGRQAESDYLRSDGRNLAPYLHGLSTSSDEEDRAAFELIVRLVQQGAPFIKTLDPTLVDPGNPSGSAVKLDWTDTNDGRFGVEPFSDGTLRLIRLYIVVEGRTEELIGNRVLRPHLAALNVFPSVHSEGGGGWSNWRRFLSKLMRAQAGADVRFTTMFDLYALPSGFPGTTSPTGPTDSRERVEFLEHAMGADLGDPRLIPYIQRHEVEALVLAGLDRLSSLLPGERKGSSALEKEIQNVGPEEVNDRYETAPSRRLGRHVPTCQKALHGPLVVEDIGLARLRISGPRFGAWLSRLEALAS